jgi:hypothetical protein
MVSSPGCSRIVPRQTSTIVPLANIYLSSPRLSGISQTDTHVGLDPLPIFHLESPGSFNSGRGTCLTASGVSFHQKTRSPSEAPYTAAASPPGPRQRSPHRNSDALERFGTRALQPRCALLGDSLTQDEPSTTTEGPAGPGTQDEANSGVRSRSTHSYGIRFMLKKVPSLRVSR